MLSNMGIVYEKLGDLERARELYGRAVVLAKRLRNDALISNALSNLAATYMDTDRARAAELLRQSIKHIDATGRRSFAVAAASISRRFSRSPASSTRLPSWWSGFWSRRRRTRAGRRPRAAGRDPEKARQVRRRPGHVSGVRAPGDRTRRHAPFGRVPFEHHRAPARARRSGRGGRHGAPGDRSAARADGGSGRRADGSRPLRVDGDFLDGALAAWDADDLESLAEFLETGRALTLVTALLDPGRALLPGKVRREEQDARREVAQARPAGGIEGGSRAAGEGEGEARSRRGAHPARARGSGRGVPAEGRVARHAARVPSPRRSAAPVGDDPVRPFALVVTPKGARVVRLRGSGRRGHGGRHGRAARQGGRSSAAARRATGPVAIGQAAADLAGRRARLRPAQPCLSGAGDRIRALGYGARDASRPSRRPRGDARLQGAGTGRPEVRRHATRKTKRRPAARGGAGATGGER